MPGIFGKPGWVLGLLAAAFIVPYTICNRGLRETVAKALASGEQQPPANNQPQPGADAPQPAAPVAAVRPPPQAPLCDMASALRFDVTPQWVTATWPRVTTAVADLSHAGLRVPLVTGVMPDDLAGTLTYYFSSDRQVQRITFAGTTADPRRLVSLVSAQYRLAQQPSVQSGLYQSRWNGRVISTLEIRQGSVAGASAGRGSYEVRLELNRADALAGTASAPRRLFGW